MALAFRTGLVLYVVIVDVILVAVVEWVLSNLYNRLLWWQLRYGKKCIRVQRNPILDAFSGWSLGSGGGVGGLFSIPAVSIANIGKAALFVAVVYSSSTLDPVIVDTDMQKMVEVATTTYVKENATTTTTATHSRNNKCCLFSDTSSTLSISFRYAEAVNESDLEGCSNTPVVHLTSCFNIYGDRLLDRCPEQVFDWAPQDPADSFVPIYDQWQRVKPSLSSSSGGFRGGMLACLRDNIPQHDIYFYNDNVTFYSVDCVYEEDKKKNKSGGSDDDNEDEGVVRFFSLLEGQEFNATNVRRRYFNGFGGVREYKGTLAPQDGANVTYLKTDLVNSAVYYCLQWLNKPDKDARIYFNLWFTQALADVYSWLEQDYHNYDFVTTSLSAHTSTQTTVFIMKTATWIVLGGILSLTIIAALFNAWSAHYWEGASNAVDSFESGLTLGEAAITTATKSPSMDGDGSGDDGSASRRNEDNTMKEKDQNDDNLIPPVTLFQLKGSRYIVAQKQPRSHHSTKTIYHIQCIRSLKTKKNSSVVATRVSADDGNEEETSGCNLELDNGDSGSGRDEIDNDDEKIIDDEVRQEEKVVSGCKKPDDSDHGGIERGDLVYDDDDNVASGLVVASGGGGGDDDDDFDGHETSVCRESRNNGDTHSAREAELDEEESEAGQKFF